MTALDAAVLVARSGLAVVFLVAGFGKLFDRAGTRLALTEFGVPAMLARWLDVLLPVGECALAAALLFGPTAWVGAAGTLALLVIFVLAIGVNLARGRTPHCHCFGQIHSAPAGWSTLIRNAALGSVAALVVASGAAQRPGFGTLVQGVANSPILSTSAMLTGIALLTVSMVFLLLVIHQQGRIILRLELIESRLPATSGTGPASPPPPVQGLPVGGRAPLFRLDRIHGGEGSLQTLLATGKPALLFFTNPKCGPCTSLLPDLARWHEQLADSLSVVLISEGTAADNLVKLPVQLRPQVWLQKDREVAEAYQAYGTPAVVLVRPDGAIGSPVAMGVEQVRATASRIIEMSRGADGRQPGRITRASALPPARLGEIAPSLQLTNSTGEAVSLQSVLTGRPTLLLFWNPDCGFCQRMLDDVRAWDVSPPPDSPQLVVISSGSVDQNRALGLRSHVFSDPTSVASSAFGAHGTPIAVLLDSEARVVSSPAAGKHAILSLAGLVAEPAGNPAAFHGPNGRELVVL